MNLLVVLGVALRALARHKMRSVLTMLGIIIGVGSVITMVGVGQGANAQVQDRMAVLGTNTLQIEAGSGGGGGVRGGLGSIRTLVNSDADAILRQVPGVVRVTPGVNGSVQVIYGNQNWAAQMQGVNAKYFLMRGWELAQGSSFTDQDVE